MVYLPAIKPSAVAFGTAFSHVSSFIVSAPVIGAACKKARSANTKEEFLRSREAASAVCINSSQLVTSALRSYAIAILLNKCGATTVKAASCVGGLVFVISALPTILTNAIVDRRPLDTLVGETVEALIDTAGLAGALAWWGVRDADILN